MAQQLEQLSTGPACGGLCAKAAQDHVLESVKSGVMDTERFCMHECVPKASSDEMAAKPGDICRPLTDSEKMDVTLPDGNARAGPQEVSVSPRFLARQSAVTGLAVRRASAGEAPPPVTKPWASTEKAGSELDKLVEKAKTNAEKANKAAEEVQQTAYKGLSAIPKAEKSVEDARQAARFAMQAEAEVHAYLEKARADAHAEAFSVLGEVLPTIQQQARAAARTEATVGPSAPVEEAQRKIASEVAKAADKGLQPWTEAMMNAAKVRDQHAARGNTLAVAAFTAETKAQSLEESARKWDALPGAPSKYQAGKLRKKAKFYMDMATDADKKAKGFFKTAKSIDDSLPAYSRQAEQGAYHEMAMVSPDVQAPLPPLVLTQQKKGM
eukprot:TRINITY_DN106663_c0_g1_i1.p1 TRINITY_DN106663_c0_g1~~TRINITY_DN106663_c0_g1_i1.p1  ORF type:complete len:448 (-),score=118.20 TRINITY_DN106663_c0_g1_i1:37-1185(-)